MTTELKPCKNCKSTSQSWTDGKTVVNGIQQNRLNTNDVECFFHLGCDDCGETLQIISAEMVAAQMNTRTTSKMEAVDATPSPVPELLRYGPKLHNNFFHHMEKSPDGAYVLHTEAAAIIAALSARCHKSEFVLDGFADGIIPTLLQRAKAAEAKLADIGKQVPIVVLDVVKVWIKEQIVNCTQCEDGDMDHQFADNIGQFLAPLYAHPVADHEVETIERCAKVADAHEDGRMKQRDTANTKIEKRDFESMAMSAMHIAQAIRALSGKKPE